MLNINYKFYLDRLFVKNYENCPNSIVRVCWICVMERNDVKLEGGGYVDLDAPDLNNFTNIEQLEAQQVIDWMIEKMGGQTWLDSYLARHDSELTRKENEKDLIPWDTPLINSIKYDTISNHWPWKNFTGS
jgi:hypothetical protein